MVNYIKLTPEQVEAIELKRRERAEQRVKDLTVRQIRKREAEQAHNALIAYMCVLCLFIGMLIGTFI